MKKLFSAAFVIICLLITSIESRSQTTLAIGLEGGVNLANVSVTPSTGSTTSRTGLILGALVDIGFTPKIGVVTGLRYVMKGFTQNGVQTNLGLADLTFKTNYMEFPVLLKVKFPLTEVKPYLIGGGTLGFKLTSDLDYVAQGGSGTQDNSNNVESIDFGLLFGGGLDFKVATKIDMFIQGAYSLGLSNVEKTQNQVGNTSTTKTNGIQITGGIKFRIL